MNVCECGYMYAHVCARAREVCCLCASVCVCVLQMPVMYLCLYV